MKYQNSQSNHVPRRMPVSSGATRRQPGKVDIRKNPALVTVADSLTLNTEFSVTESF
jgi:hypothetical protein